MATRQRYGAFALIATVACAGTALAQDGVRYAEPASDAANYLGDRVDHPAVLRVKTLNGAGSKEVAGAGCLPARTTLRGLGKAKLKVGEAGKETEVEHDVFVVRELPAAEGAGREAAIAKAQKEACGKDLVSAGATIAIEPAVLSALPPDRYGFTFGTLFVPFKYQFRGDRSLAGGATLGGYMGYRSTVWGTSTLTRK